MSIKRYKIIYDCSFEADIEIDDAKCSEDLLHSINRFWGGDERRLAEANGKILNAVLKILMIKLLELSVTKWDALSHMQAGKEEGWPPLDGSYGIKLISLIEFYFSEDDINVQEVTA